MGELLLQLFIVLGVVGVAWLVTSAIPYFEMIERNRVMCAEDRAGDDDCMGDEGLCSVDVKSDR
jgi:hypothetical protein